METCIAASRCKVQHPYFTFSLLAVTLPFSPKAGNGLAGFEEGGPYDAILVTVPTKGMSLTFPPFSRQRFSCLGVPQKLIDQLKPGTTQHNTSQHNTTQHNSTQHNNEG